MNWSVLALLTFFSICATQMSIASPRIQDQETGVYFEIDDNSHSSSGWCAWFAPFEPMAKDYTLELPEGWTHRTQVVFCDRVKVEAGDHLEFIEALQQRYPNCMTIKVNQETKTISVKIGSEMAHGTQDNIQEFSVVLASGEKRKVQTTRYNGAVQNYCAHNIENALSKDSGEYLIFKTAMAVGP